MHTQPSINPTSSDPLATVRNAGYSALAAAREELTAAEKQWLTLEMRREEIEGPDSSN